MRMGLRAIALTAAASIGVGLVSTVALVAPAAASGPADGSVVAGATAPQVGAVANTPFSSGQLVNVVIPANTDLPRTANVNLVECSAPGGVVPTSPSACDGNTIQGPSIHPRSDGSLDLHAQTATYYSVYALPNLNSLGETSGPACDLTNPCMLYIGDNQNDFTAPHYWSPAFSVNPNGGDDSGANPGDGGALSATLTLAKATTATGFTAAGQSIPYTYLVTNTGNVALTGISVSDNKNSVSCPSASLAAGANETCTGSYTVTAADVTNGSVTNIATTHATRPTPVSSAPSQVTVSSPGPADGSILPGASAPVGSVTAGTPFSSGQQINVVVPANTDLPHNTNVNVVECSAPNGVTPTTPSACDGNTIQGPSLHPRSNGSVDLHGQTNTLFTLYALPDFGSLGETSGVTCDLHTRCILYIGDNQNDFTAPHYWSQPFSINPNGGVDSGASPGDGTAPSATLTLGKATTTTSYTAVGQSIPYTYVVTNTGNLALTGVSVTDNRNSVSCPSSTLAIGANETCTGSYTVTQADLSAGSITNTAAAHATGPIAAASPAAQVTVTGGACAPPAITSADAVTATAGTAFSFTVRTCAPAPPGLKAAGLPAGLSLVSNGDGTATISGTPAGKDHGVDVATITATLKGQPTATQSLAVTVDNAPVFKVKTTQTAATGSAFSDPITTLNGYPVPTITTGSALPAGVTLSDHHDGTAVLAGTPGPAAGGTYPITLTATNGVGSPVNQLVTLTVYQAAAFTGAGSDAVTTGAPITPFTVHDTGYPVPVLKAKFPSGLVLTDNHDGTGTISGTPSIKDNGVYTVAITAAVKTQPAATQNFVLTVSNPPVFKSKPVVTAATGAAYSATVTTASGYPVPALSTASALPAGITLVDNGDGTAGLVGTPGPAAGGAYPITLAATNGVGTPVTQSFTLTVSQAPAVTSAVGDTVAVGAAMAPVTVTATGYPIPTVKAAGLPSGLALADHHDGTATLSGTPKAAGTFNVTITAASKAGSASQSFALTVTP